MLKGNNGDFVHNSTGSALLEFFSKAGSLFEKRTSSYGSETSALKLFKPAFSTDKEKAAKLAFWLRDARGGAGNRSGFRSVVNWIATTHPEWIKANIALIPETGRWDDLIACIDTPCEDTAITHWAEAITSKDGLACKWAPREKKNKVVFAKLRKKLGMAPKQFRKFISENTNVVETSMCSGDWHGIDYNRVPSVAMGRSAKAFLKHDPARYEEWKESLTDETSNTKVNAGALFPHDVLRTSRRDGQLADAQFNALPDFMDGTTMRIMPICDFSGSMGWAKVSGEITPLDISLSLGLYCSDRVGESNPFYRKFIPFSSTSKLISWKGKGFTQASTECNDGWCGSTNVKAALDQILESAQMLNATNDQIPNCLLIISDMQFDQGARDGSETVIETCMKEWEANGYSRPNIVYWNTAGYEGAPAKGSHDNVALISGFSPSILGSVLGGTDFSPMAILERAIEKYPVIVPAGETATV